MAHRSIIGKDMLQMLMFSLYPEPETIYREYLQNASDSIQEAKIAGILGEGEGHVTIKISETKQQIVINDDGIGIPSDRAEAVLKDIAASPKKNKSYVAGYYGIGRLVGAGYCNQLVFRTSCKDETLVSVLVIDVQKIRDCLDDESNAMTATEVFDSAASFSIENGEDADKHYFEVSLNDILPEYAENLLDENKIRDYLIQVAPIDFTAPFKSTLVQPSLETTEENIKEEITDYVTNLNNVKVSLNDIVDIQKKYSYKVEGLDDEIDTLRYFVLKDKSFGTLAWGWYAVTAFTVQIPDTIPNTNPKQPVLTRGLRLRIKNIQIGTATFFDGTEYFRQARSNKYFNGEIHVVNENIKPTTDRSDLAPSKETQALKKLLTDFFNTEMQGVYQNANKAKTALNELIKIEKESADFKQKEKTGILTAKEKEEKAKIPERLEKVRRDIQQRITDKKTNSVGENQMLALYKKRLDDINTKIERGEIGRLVLSDANKNSSRTTSSAIPQPEQDIFAGLDEKYSEGQVAIIKKIFAIIDANFYSDAYKRITHLIKTRVLKELKK